MFVFLKKDLKLIFKSEISLYVIMLLIITGLLLPFLLLYFFKVKVDKDVIEGLIYISNYLPNLIHEIEMQGNIMFFMFFKLYLFGFFIITAVFSFIISAILFMKERNTIDILLFAPMKSDKLILKKLLGVSFIVFILILPVFLFGILDIFAYFYNLISFKNILYLLVFLYLVIVLNINISIIPVLRIDNKKYIYLLLIGMFLIGFALIFWVSFYKNNVVFLIILNLILFNLNVRILRLC